MTIKINNVLKPHACQHQCHYGEQSKEMHTGGSDGVCVCIHVIQDTHKHTGHWTGRVCLHTDHTGDL